MKRWLLPALLLALLLSACRSAPTILCASLSCSPVPGVPPITVSVAAAPRSREDIPALSWEWNRSGLMLTVARQASFTLRLPTPQGEIVLSLRWRGSQFTLWARTPDRRIGELQQGTFPRSRVPLLTLKLPVSSLPDAVLTLSWSGETMTYSFPT